MRREFPDDVNGFRAAVREETKRSRFRDRWSRERIHPFDYDVHSIVGFVIERHRRFPPEVFDAARILCRRTDTDAIRVLVYAVLEGPCGLVMRRRCGRLLWYCDVIETALAIRDWYNDGPRNSERN
jgi:hypothetical protein